jgi:hypothetical protein
MEIGTIGIDPTKWVEMKKQYTLDLAITKQSWAPGPHNAILYRLPLMIFGNAEWSTGGQWGTSYFGASILGMSSGYWDIGSKNYDGVYNLSLYTEKPPNAVSLLWEDFPEGCGMLENIAKFPLSIGATGRGNMHLPQNNAEYRWLTWKVADRSF